MAEYVELYMDQGVDFSTTIAINDDDSNLPQNTVGYIVTSKLKKSLLSANASETFVCTISDGANGEILMEMASANTANLKPGRYFFDVKVIDTSNLTSRLIEGIIVVTPGITK
jgi:hypothetical protein